MLYYRLVADTSSNEEKKLKKVYTFNKENAMTATPAKFSIDDKYSEERVRMKKRCKVWPFDDSDK